MRRHALIAALMALGSSTLGSAGGIPLITPGAPAPDGNGWVQKAVAHAQLADGRLLVGLTFTGAVSPITGQPLSSNYGVYNYDIESGAIVQEFRHDYPTNQGGTPNCVGHWCEDLQHVPLVLDNGDRIYAGRGDWTSPLYRYVDGQGLIYHGAYAYYWIRNMYDGLNGYLSALDSDVSAGTRHLALTCDGTTVLMARGYSIPGGGQVQFTGSTSTCGQDGWYTYGVTFYSESRAIVQSKAGQVTRVLRHPVSHAFLSPLDYSSVWSGEQAIGIVGPDVLVQARPTEPLTLALAEGQSLRGDERVNAGRPLAGGRIEGFADGSFLTTLNVDDSATGQRLGTGVCLFNSDGTLRGAVIPGDPNPFGPGTVQTVGSVQAQSRVAQYGYDNEPAVALRVHIDDGGTLKWAWWQMDMDGNTQQAFAQGQAIPGTSAVVTRGDFGEFTPDGRTIYRVGAGNIKYWEACYTPGVGLRWDVPRESAGTEVFVGPNGERAYDVDSQYDISIRGCWLVNDANDEALLVAYPGMPVRDGAFEVEGTYVAGFTAGGRLVLRLDLQQTASPFDETRVWCLYDDTGLTELVDLMLPFDGKQLDPYGGVEFDDDYPAWLYCAPGDRPIANVLFADGTMGLYALPEPATFGLLAVSGLILLWRRR